MGRRASVRRGSNVTGSRPSTLNENGDGNQSGDGNRHGKNSFEQQPQTAPLDNDWPGSDARMKGKHREDKRGKSEERSMAAPSQENLSSSYPKAKDKKEGGNSFMSGLKKATGGFLGRTKSDSKTHIPDSEYVIKVINLPLVEQTRATRISKDLASCRDKTEYWMPALPWRCIE